MVTTLRARSEKLAALHRVVTDNTTHPTSLRRLNQTEVITYGSTQNLRPRKFMPKKQHPTRPRPLILPGPGGWGGGGGWERTDKTAIVGDNGPPWRLRQATGKCEDTDKANCLGLKAVKFTSRLQTAEQTNTRLARTKPAARR